MKVLRNASLKAFNTFGVDEKCRELVIVESEDDIYALCQKYSEAIAQGNYAVLGGGSDVLILQNLDYPVFVLRLKGIRVERAEKEFCYVRAYAGEVWDGFVREMIGRNLFGLENLARIPGTVGAAPIQNIGAYGAEVGHFIDSIRVVNLRDGTQRDLRQDECDFQYRHSVFKKVQGRDLLIVSVTFKLARRWEANLRYHELAKLVHRNNALSAMDVYELVSAIRKRKIPDPALLGNAGSFFKNPIVSEKLYRELLERWPLMPSHAAGEGLVKIPAAWLLDQAGWKGRRIQHVGTYEHTPLIIVNYGGASGQEILEFSSAMRADVLAKFGIDLEPEVVRIS